jgi:Spy/CpxP family protein refolding chaperone
MTKADLRKRTSLPVKQIDDELSKLASFNLIKALKKGEKKNAKLWALFHEQEDDEQEQRKESSRELVSLILKRNNSIAAIKMEAVKHALSLEGFEQIVEMLTMRGDITVRNGNVSLRKMNKLFVPCVSCELQRLCSTDGVITPECCPYLANW